MSRAQRVYTPPPEVAARPHAAEDGGSGRQRLVFLILLIALGALAAVVWGAYAERPSGEDDLPVIAAPETFKSRFQADAPSIPTATLDQALQGETDLAAGAVATRPPAERPLSRPAVVAEAVVARGPDRPPVVAANGAYLAQIAALRSRDAAELAWSRFAKQAPALFAPMKRDVQEADLGAKGVYHRLRAGYFADREEASRFCDRVKALGQECIVVGR
jgi:cell division septation protein DedD